jgi:hypothetical protein
MGFVLYKPTLIEELFLFFPHVPVILSPNKEQSKYPVILFSSILSVKEILLQL